MLYIKRAAFTLIELSIVLVVIGLIIGGVLVGRDLIRAAGVHATVSQIDKYRASVNTFRLKYGCLPGDMPATTAGQLGFFQFNASVAGTPGFGDGNGFIDRTQTPTQLADKEILVFWRHLSEASLVDGTFGQSATYSITNTTGAAAATTSAVDIGQYFPTAKLGGGNYIYVASKNFAATFPFTNFGNTNFFSVFSYSVINTDGTYTGGPAVPPSDNYALDTKIDDGLPNVGHVLGNGNWAATSASGNCKMGSTSATDAAAIYNVGSSVADNTSCQPIMIW